MTFSHQTVLLKPTVELLAPAPGRVLVDGTLGGGGHTEALLEAGAMVYGIDRDPVALEAAQERLARFGDRFRPVRGNFSELTRLLADALPVDGVLVDLGVSSPQLDVAERGFSFQTDGPLDMRMGPDGPTAAELIEDTPEGELADLIYRLGDERFSRPIARELKARRPQRTLEAVDAIKAAVPRRAWPDKINVATRTFQALRMAVNRELESLDGWLQALPAVLKVGGRAAVISFHSLEDRRVKDAFRELEGRCICPPAMPVCGCGRQGDFKPVTRKAVTADEGELAQNPRARSARLRVVERVR